MASPAPGADDAKRTWYALGCLLAVYPAFLIRDAIWQFDEAGGTGAVFRVLLARNVVDAVLLGGFALFIARRFPFPHRAAAPWKRLVLAGTVLGAGTFLIEGTLIVSSLRLIELLGSGGRVPPFWLVTRHARTPTEILVLIMSVGLITPIVEEVFFRGVLYRSLAATMPWSHAVLFSSAVFALFHGPAMMPVALALGVVAALTVEKSGSLLPGVMLHSGLNCGFVFYNAAYSRMLWADSVGVALYTAGGAAALALGALIVKRLPQPVDSGSPRPYNTIQGSD